MRVFLAGASGVIGRALVPLLVDAGHDVVGTTRTREGAAVVAGLGATPVILDVYDAARVDEEAGGADVVLHELTDLPDDAAAIPAFAERNRRIRTEGTAILVAAARHAGARIVAQSIAWAPPTGGESIAAHERLVLDAGGVVLRYGMLYGPGTYYPDAALPPRPRVAVDDAARRTVDHLAAPSGVITIDDGSE